MLTKNCPVSVQSVPCIERCIKTKNVKILYKTILEKLSTQFPCSLGVKFPKQVKDVMIY
jgi:hypothetical protein